MLYFLRFRLVFIGLGLVFIGFTKVLGANCCIPFAFDLFLLVWGWLFIFSLDLICLVFTFAKRKGKNKKSTRKDIRRRVLVSAIGKVLVVLYQAKAKKENAVTKLERMSESLKNVKMQNLGPFGGRPRACVLRLRGTS